MRKFLLFISLLLLLPALAIAEPITAKWDFKVQNDVTQSPYVLKASNTSSEGNWTVTHSTSNYSSDKTNGPRFGSKSDPLQKADNLTLSESGIPNNALISKVVFTIKGNSKDAASSWNLKINNNIVGETKSASGSGITQLTWDNVSATGNNITIELTENTTGGLNMQGVEITYEEGADPAEPTAYAAPFDGQTYNLSIGQSFQLPMGNAYPANINYTGGHNYLTITNNTVSALAVTDTPQQITASWEASENWLAGSASFTVNIAEAQLIDELTTSILNLSGNSYTAGAYTSPVTGIEYSYDVMYNTSGIYFNNTNKRGIIITKNPNNYDVKRISVTWGGNTDNTFQIYGKAAEYTPGSNPLESGSVANELYDNATRGTLIAELTGCDGNADVLDDHYKALGFRSKQKNLQIAKIVIEYAKPTAAPDPVKLQAPVINIDDVITVTNPNTEGGKLQFSHTALDAEPVWQDYESPIVKYTEPGEYTVKARVLTADAARFITSDTAEGKYTVENPPVTGDPVLVVTGDFDENGYFETSDDNIILNVSVNNWTGNYTYNYTLNGNEPGMAGSTGDWDNFGTATEENNYSFQIPVDKSCTVKIAVGAGETADHNYKYVLTWEKKLTRVSTIDVETIAEAVEYASIDDYDENNVSINKFCIAAPVHKFAANGTSIYVTDNNESGARIDNIPADLNHDNVLQLLTVRYTTAGAVPHFIYVDALADETPAAPQHRPFALPDFFAKQNDLMHNYIKLTDIYYDHDTRTFNCFEEQSAEAPRRVTATQGHPSASLAINVDGLDNIPGLKSGFTNAYGYVEHNGTEPRFIVTSLDDIVTSTPDILVSQDIRTSNGCILAPEGSYVFTVDGMQVNAAARQAAGIYIVRTPDGKSHKLYIR